MLTKFQFLGSVLLFSCLISCKTVQPGATGERSTDTSGEPGPEKKEAVTSDTAAKRDIAPQTDPNQQGCVQGNCENGAGMFVYPSGDRYTGNFKNGLREGPGVMEYANGDRYEGGYAADQRQGQGTYTFKNRDVFVGQFRQGSRDGAGTYRFADTGEMFLGELKEDGNSGEGTLKKGDQEMRCSLKGKSILCEPPADRTPARESTEPQASS